ncbi:hypothetical protein [Listeria booriae]|uniref:hypothetical protein n=1 Tax=Listeria booriae TaxID=1552123 RepID=UPI00162A09E9|nr:hypothetical protein [Listeria booriae]MBC2149739.1 hypothetical protein [Listeria booriae]MBC6164674.1 hypothetical protein [Listeria booriae]
MLDKYKFYGFEVVKGLWILSYAFLGLYCYNATITALYAYLTEHGFVGEELLTTLHGLPKPIGIFIVTMALMAVLFRFVFTLNPRETVSAAGKSVKWILRFSMKLSTSLILLWILAEMPETEGIYKRIWPVIINSANFLVWLLFLKHVQLKAKMYRVKGVIHNLTGRNSGGTKQDE